MLRSPNQIGHMGIDDPECAGGNRDPVHVERFSDLIHRALCRRAIEHHRSAEKSVLRNISKQKIDIRYGGVNRHGHSRRGRGSAPVLCGPTRSILSSSTHTMLPPPAPHDSTATFGMAQV